MNDFHRLDSVDNQDNFTFISKLFPQKKVGFVLELLWSFAIDQRPVYGIFPPFRFHEILKLHFTFPFNPL